MRKTKKELRKIFKDQRNQIKSSDLTKKSKQIYNIFSTKLDFSFVNTLHTFIPILHHKEPDTWHIIHYLWQNCPNIQVISSISHFEDSSMSHFLLNHDTTLEANQWGIMEATDPISYDGEIDLVLVPLLVADLEGYRVGYGKGFYDRFLAKHPNALKVGISLFPLVEHIKDTDQYDIRLDALIHPDGLISFSDQ